MSTAELRMQAKQVIEALPPAQLRVAATFLAFLDAKESKASTPALTAVAKLRRQIKAAEKDIAAGRGVDWRKVRNDV
jgi:hypothetical protein